jgi:hypothetical protein
MNPILQAAVGSILRYALMVLAAFLVKKGIWSDSAAEGYVEAGVIALLALGWSLWKNYQSRSHLMVALTLPVGSTENDVKAKIASGDAIPTVNTPPNTPPGTPA